MPLLIWGGDNFMKLNLGGGQRIKFSEKGGPSMVGSDVEENF